jgi:hypothetical protein
VYTVVFDDRFAESRRFGAAARRLGYRTSVISGDVTALWYDDLYHRWKRGAAPIAGLTTADAAFCLKIFGEDAGLRCVFRGEHRPGEDEAAVDHELLTPAGWSPASLLEHCGDAWPELIPSLFNACPAASARNRGSARSQVRTPASADHPALVSWLLAPLSRA